MDSRSIVLITVDALRADCLGCYGASDVKTSNIDRLAADGILFRNAFATGPNTTTSVPSLLTSRFVPFLSPGTPTVATVLRQGAGHATVAVNPNVQLIYDHCRELGLTRGFDVYDTMLGRARQRFEIPVEASIRVAGTIITRYLGPGNPIFRVVSGAVGYATLPIALPAPRARKVTERAMSHLGDASEPFFLWLFYLDVHSPYLPPQQYRSWSSRRRLMHMNRKLRYFRRNLSPGTWPSCSHCTRRRWRRWTRRSGSFLTY